MKGVFIRNTKTKIDDKGTSDGHNSVPFIKLMRIKLRKSKQEPLGYQQNDRAARNSQTPRQKSHNRLLVDLHRPIKCHSPSAVQQKQQFMQPKGTQRQQNHKNTNRITNKTSKGRIFRTFRHSVPFLEHSETMLTLDIISLDKRRQFMKNAYFSPESSKSLGDVQEVSEIFLKPKGPMRCMKQQRSPWIQGQYNRPKDIEILPKKHHNINVQLGVDALTLTMSPSFFRQERDPRYSELDSSSTRNSKRTDFVAWKLSGKRAPQWELQRTIRAQINLL